MKLSHRWFADWGGRDAENVVGFQLRNDDIPTVGLYHTKAIEPRSRRVSLTTSF